MLHLWSAKLETGLPKIDEQHKELFRQVGVLMDRTKTAADRIPETLKFLGDYVLQHFTDEQGLQAAVRYPKIEAHKKYHTAFVAKFSELRKKFEDSGDDIKFEVVTEINSVAVGWLKDHIMVHDKEFADYYKQHQKDRLSRGPARAAAQAPSGAAPGLWRPELETGIPKLDEQHKEMFRRIEALADEGTLTSLGQYTANHFRAEERAQARIGYPGAQAHQRIHNDFLRKLKDMKNKLAADAGGRAAPDLGRALANWLRDHIMAQDRDFAAYYKKHRQGGQERRGFWYRLFHPFSS